MRLLAPEYERRRESNLDSSRDGLCEIVFQGEDIAGVALKGLGPEVSIVTGRNQPRVDSHLAAGACYRALHNRIHAEFLADFHQGLVIPFVMIRGGTGNDFDRADLGE